MRRSFDIGARVPASCISLDKPPGEGARRLSNRSRPTAGAALTTTACGGGSGSAAPTASRPGEGKVRRERPCRACELAPRGRVQKGLAPQPGHIIASAPAQPSAWPRRRLPSSAFAHRPFSRLPLTAFRPALLREARISLTALAGCRSHRARPRSRPNWRSFYAGHDAGGCEPQPDVRRELRDFPFCLEPPRREWLPWTRGLGMSESPTLRGLGMSELA